MNLGVNYTAVRQYRRNIYRASATETLCNPVRTDYLTVSTMVFDTFLLFSAKWVQMAYTRGNFQGIALIKGLNFSPCMHALLNWRGRKEADVRNTNLVEQ